MIRQLALTAALAALAGPAFAQDVSNQSVPMSGSVARLCVLGAPTPSAVDLGQLANTSGQRVGRLTTVSDRSVTLPASFCNYAGSRLTVTSSALLAADTSTVQGGFARAVNYTATVSNWAPVNAVATTSAAANGAGPSASASGGDQAAPRLADLQLTLSNFTAPADSLLVAGGYAGSVTVTLGPQ
jgi:hypothetical protein